MFHVQLRDPDNPGTPGLEFVRSGRLLPVVASVLNDTLDARRDWRTTAFVVRDAATGRVVDRRD